MEDKKTEIIINVNGGSVHILLDATHVVQHIYIICPQGQGDAPAFQKPDESSRLSIYISNEKVRSKYVSQLQSCRSAAEVGEDGGGNGGGGTWPDHRHCQVA